MTNKYKWNIEKIKDDCVTYWLSRLGNDQTDIEQYKKYEEMRKRNWHIEETKDWETKEIRNIDIYCDKECIDTWEFDEDTKEYILEEMKNE